MEIHQLKCDQCGKIETISDKNTYFGGRLKGKKFEISDFVFVDDGSIHIGDDDNDVVYNIGVIPCDVFEEIVAARKDIMNRAASINSVSPKCNGRLRR